MHTKTAPRPILAQKSTATAFLGGRRTVARALCGRAQRVPEGARAPRGGSGRGGELWRGHLVAASDLCCIRASRAGGRSERVRALPRRGRRRARAPAPRDSGATAGDAGGGGGGSAQRAAPAGAGAGGGERRAAERGGRGQCGRLLPGRSSGCSGSRRGRMRALRARGCNVSCELARGSALGRARARGGVGVGGRARRERGRRVCARLARGAGGTSRGSARRGGTCPTGHGRASAACSIRQTSIRWRT